MCVCVRARVYAYRDVCVPRAAPCRCARAFETFVSIEITYATPIYTPYVLFLVLCCAVLFSAL